MSLKRFGVSLEDSLLEDLDNYVNENGFSNRSQAIRFLIEKNIAEKKWQCNHTVAGSIVIMYEYERKDISARVTAIGAMYKHAILSSSQYYISNDKCLHVVVVKGEARVLTELADKLTTIKGLLHGKLVMSRAD